MFVKYHASGPVNCYPSINILPDLSPRLRSWKKKKSSGPVQGSLNKEIVYFLLGAYAVLTVFYCITGVIVWWAKMSEIAESFASALSELTVNSKPHINMLTMLSDDHLDYAPIITQTVFNHLQKVNIQLIFFNYLLTGGLLKMSNVFHTWLSNPTANACLNLYQITIVVF